MRIAFTLPREKIETASVLRLVHLPLHVADAATEAFMRYEMPILIAALRRHTGSVKGSEYDEEAA